ncbi:hypothetical protein CW745_11795 [Psychromonas sp. psych-6C06]|uniref:hypothetical protein n=1 Tax=Psychromonas sp. psych-6C06 TaxID=2058089 RepID=UPI000C32E8ED|nr:hypothetical protein [Psychromonas sp. psych-6C06]PKF60990.1 hypothetical protein CW745_11795 [Psychromonas sp. psych-6C06]
MYETIHVIKVGNKDYMYDAIKSAVRKNGKVTTFMRTYGEKRTKEEAIALVLQWEKENKVK